MEIRNINWISKEAEEAILTLCDEGVEITCFCHPYKGSLDLTSAVYVDTLNANGISEANERGFYTERLSREAIPRHLIVGKVLTEDVIQLAGFHIVLDAPLPGDIGVGKYIQFFCDRLSL